MILAGVRTVYYTQRGLQERNAPSVPKTPFDRCKTDEAEFDAGQGTLGAEGDVEITTGQPLAGHAPGRQVFIKTTGLTCESKTGRGWGAGMAQNVVWCVVEEFAKMVVIEKLAFHDLRRTCARPCRAAGGEQEQIQFMGSHVSAQAAEGYLGCKSRIKSAQMTA